MCLFLHFPDVLGGEFVVFDVWPMSGEMSGERGMIYMLLLCDAGS